jgi:hypothetical protein
MNFDSIHVNQPHKMLVVWSLGDFCPYSCSYCPKVFHQNKTGYHAYEDVINTFNRLPEKTRIVMSGGEPSYHPDIERILDAKVESHDIGFITNAARPLAFWERVLPKVHSLIFTYHTEFANLDRFIETSQACKSKLEHINLTMIPGMWDKCRDVYDRFLKEGLPVSPKPLMEDFGIRSTAIISGYTQEQLDWIKKTNETKSPKYIILKDSSGNIVGRTNPSEMLAGKMNNFQGWTCNTQMDRLYIIFNGEVWSTSCKQRKLLGNIKDGFELIQEPAVCEQTFCWSHSDISTFKSKKYP